MSGALGYKFGLPPSLGREPSWALARELAALLDASGFTTVVPCKTYLELERQLLVGELDAAWAPPLPCARVEAAGGSIALRGVRRGETTYRSVLVTRAQDALELDALGRPELRLRAAWVDRESTAGYLLPRAHVRGLGFTLETAFAHQVVLGSYAACIDALLGFETDFTALFVAARGLDFWGPKAKRLRALAYTAEVPNDAIVVSPALSTERSVRLLAQLGRLLAQPAQRRAITAILQVDDFDRPAPGTYAPVLALLG